MFSSIHTDDLLAVLHHLGEHDEVARPVKLGARHEYQSRPDGRAGLGVGAKAGRPCAPLAIRNAGAGQESGLELKSRWVLPTGCSTRA